MKNNVQIIKCNHTGTEVWRYAGHLIHETKLGVSVEARFNRSDLPFHGLVFKQNDRFLELYLHHRWFNIYAIHDRDDDELKGFYCNITHPIRVTYDEIIYDDLALDLLVYPDGTQLILDEDDFNLLPLSKQERENANHGMADLQHLLKNPALFSFMDQLGRD